jgi:ribonucleoside-diphosphate reductase alpha chain
MSIQKKSERSLSLNEEMYVTKRNGKKEIVSFDKILNRIKKIGQGTNMKLNYTSLVMKVIDQLFDGISTTKIDELSAEQCATMASIHPDYSILAGSIIISNHHKNTSDSFVDVMSNLYFYLDKHEKHSPLISEKTYEIIQKNSEFFEEICDYSRDYLIDYFGFKTLERAYLMKINNKIVERIQHMWLRVSIGIHEDDLEKVKETYDLMSMKYFTHATPTLFNAGTPHPQCSSCYLISLESDSIEGIYNTLKDCALISKWAGGIGLHIHNVRASGSHIRGTNGTSNGIVPMLKVFNNTAKYVDQCVHPETIIYTTNGPIEIQHCIMGETKIINLLGKEEVIQNVLEHDYNGEVLEIDTMHSIHPLFITHEHPVYALVGQQKGLNFKVIKNRLDKKICEMEWVDAKDLTKDDMVVYSIPKYEKDITNINEEDCYMYGILLGDGSLNNKTDSTGYVSIHTINKKHISDFIENYFNKSCTNYNINIENNTTRIRWNKNLNLPFRYNDFYNENKEKRMQARWMHLPLEKAKYILKGLLDTDGSNKNELVFDSTSYQLIESVRYLAMRMGVLTSGYIRDRRGEFHETENGIIENKKISYCLRIPKTKEICELMNTTYNEKQFFKFMRYNDYLLSRIQDIRTNNYNGILYDLQLEKEHNYMLHNGLVHNGGGRRNGSFAIYLEPWHADIEMFLQMRKNHGDEELKARDLFYALWVPDLFMERIKADGTWTLMCPDECPGLSDVYGDEFKELYTKYERENKGRVTMKARDLWFQVLDAQMETGTPYLVYKDAANKKSNQQNVGTIKSSNLCVAPETMILTDKGYFRIENIENETVNVWNGEEFTETTVKKTGENQELIEIHFDDGTRIDCTKYHKFYIRNDKSIDDDDDDDKQDDVICLKAKDLSIGDYIIDYSLPVINGKDKYLELEFESELNQTFTYLPPYTHGVLSSSAGKYDYSITKYRTKGSDSVPVLKISQHKDEILPYLNYIRRTEEFVYEDNKDILYSTLILSSNVGDKFYVPINDSLKYKLEWFSGLCDIDAKVSEKVNTVTLESVNITFARELKLMLQTCGVNSYSVELGFVNYVCIDIPSMVKLINLGLKLRCKNIEKFILEKYEKMVELNTVYSSRKKMVSKIVHKGRRSDTFCFTELKRGMGIFNGIITGQCSEIIQYSDENETAVCNLSSIALPSFIEMDNVTKKNIINYEKLHEVTKVITVNLNKIIDINYYPTEKTRLSNMRHRPIGIGVQGLADVFMMMNLPFGSDEARKLNHDIFETIYYAALECSSELSQKYGSYETFLGSPASKGQLQFDLWGISPTLEGEEPRYDWNEMKERIKLYGLRNSLLLAPMPTASTSQILGNNECIEPITSNIYNRRTIAGEFILTNKYLMNDLIKLDLWNEKIKNNIIANNGSVQHIDVIPSEIREKYKTVWEIPMRTLIDMAADRGAFICQSQSLNLWLEEPNYSNLTSMHFYAWSKGLKTGIYYLRRRGRHQAQQFTIEPEKKNLENNLYEDDEPCEMCSA